MKVFGLLYLCVQSIATLSPRYTITATLNRELLNSTDPGLDLSVFQSSARHRATTVRYPH
jgi:hypothetical protein